MILSKRALVVSDESNCSAEIISLGHKRMDRLFAIILGIQWVTISAGSIFLAFFSDLLGFAGVITNRHWMGFFVCGALSIPAAFLNWYLPGQNLNKYLTVVSQIVFISFLILMTEGSPEAHFYLFLSIAAFGFYQNLTVMTFATTLGGLLLLIQGYLFSLSDPIYAFFVLFAGFALGLGHFLLSGQTRQILRALSETRKEKENSLRLLAIKSNFINNMVHEIRTPLSAICGYGELLSETRLDHEQSDYVDTIKRCSETLLRTVNETLDLSKIEGGHITLNPEYVNPQEFADEQKKLFNVQCRKKGLQFDINLEPSLPSLIFVDSYRLKRILMNLIANAIKFTDEGFVHVGIRYDKTSQELIFRIQDSGTGIHPDNLAKIFENFYQEATYSSELKDGAGLGLVIVKNLVELMKGDIQVESKLGEGTVFTVILPQYQNYGEASSKSSPI
jgi:signal transduction histidine kinase